jgi:hypothetical protein
MPASQPELGDLLDDICASIGEILVSHAQLTEGLVDDAATDTAKEKVERLKQKTADAKQQLEKLRDAQRRKRELLTLNKATQNESRDSGMVTFRNGAGKVVGYMRAMGPNRTDYFFRSGKLVAREIGGMTYDAEGKAVYQGKLGLVVLGHLLH